MNLFFLYKRGVKNLSNTLTLYSICAVLICVCLSVLTLISIHKTFIGWYKENVLRNTFYTSFFSSFISIPTFYNKFISETKTYVATSFLSFFLNKTKKTDLKRICLYWCIAVQKIKQVKYLRAEKKTKNKCVKSV